MLGERKPVVMGFDRAVPGGVATLNEQGIVPESQLLGYIPISRRGQPNGVAPLGENGKVPNSALDGAAYVHPFTAADWTMDADGVSVTITIPGSTHGLGSVKAVECQAFMLVNGVYRNNVWGAMETFAYVQADQSIVLKYPEVTGYDGMAVLRGFNF